MDQDCIKHGHDNMVSEDVSVQYSIFSSQSYVVRDALSWLPEALRLSAGNHNDCLDVGS